MKTTNPGRPASGRRHEQHASPATAVDFAVIVEACQHHWPTLKSVLKEQYLVLTDDDLAYIEGREHELLERLERKTGRPRDEFENLIFLHTQAVLA